VETSQCDGEGEEATGIKVIRYLIEANWPVMAECTGENLTMVHSLIRYVSAYPYSPTMGALLRGPV
jgi:hypothetical protein